MPWSSNRFVGDGRFPRSDHAGCHVHRHDCGTIFGHGEFGTQVTGRTMTAKPQEPQSITAPMVAAFFDRATNTISYVVKDPTSAACAIIDPVLDFDYAAGRISYGSADKIIAFVRANQMAVEWIIETHIHADHLSAGAYLKQHLGGKTAVSEKISLIQKTFAPVFGDEAEMSCDGSQFDYLFEDDANYAVGNLPARALATPGHTPACMTHLIGDAAFVGDTLFMPDSGTARTDFPGGDARHLYQSIQKILSLPDQTRLFMCHDYGGDGRSFAWQTTISDQRRANIHVHTGINSDEFVALREARDKTLSMPALIIPSVQVNMRGGHLPRPDHANRIFLKVPINAI
jgi:glyoxylase-like metal-dependent hydrolase (beta-lactamase superfamily II)